MRGKTRMLPLEARNLTFSKIAIQVNLETIYDSNYKKCLAIRELVFIASGEPARVF